MGQQTVVTVGGGVDAYTAGQLRDHLIGLFQAGQCHLLLDLGAWSSWTPPASGARRGVEAGTDATGPLRLVSLRPHLKIVQVTGLDRVFSIDEDLAAAVSAPVHAPESGTHLGRAG